jgi:hypothetical protein
MFGSITNLFVASMVGTVFTLDQFAFAPIVLLNSRL